MRYHSIPQQWPYMWYWYYQVGGSLPIVHPCNRSIAHYQSLIQGKLWTLDFSDEKPQESRWGETFKIYTLVKIGAPAVRTTGYAGGTRVNTLWVYM